MRLANADDVSRVEEIRKLEQLVGEYEDAAQRYREDAEKARWRAAELIHSELTETGKSHRQLGQEIGKSHTHVRRMAKVWECYGNQVSDIKLPFNKLYRAVDYVDAQTTPISWLKRRGSTSAIEDGKWRRRQLIDAFDTLIAALDESGVLQDSDMQTRAELLVVMLSGTSYRADPRFVEWLARRQKAGA